MVDQETLQAVSESVPSILEFALIPDELRKIADSQKDPQQKKRLKEISKFLEEELVTFVIYSMRSPKIVAYDIIKLLLKGKYFTNEEIAKEIGRSPSTVRQYLWAIRNGGVEVKESSAYGYTIGPQGGRPKKSRSIKLN